MRHQTIIKRLERMAKEIENNPDRRKDIRVREAYIDLTFRLLSRGYIKDHCHYLGLYKGVHGYIFSR